MTEQTDRWYDDNWYDLGEAMAALNVNSRQAVYGLVKRGRIEGRRINLDVRGNRTALRFNPESITTYLQSKR